MWGNGGFLNILPFGEIIKKWMGELDVYQIITYEFELESTAYISSAKIKKFDDKGLITVNIGQAEYEKKTYWRKSSIWSILGTVGGQAVSLVALVRLLILGHYQNFAYQRDALKSNYYDVRPSNEDF